MSTARYATERLRALLPFGHAKQAAQTGLQVTPVTDKRALLAFIEFPFALYRADPHWVPPLIEERLHFFDRRKNVFWEHADYQLWLVRRDGEVVGTVGAVIDRLHNEVHAAQMAGFGFFETIDDPAIAALLLATAEEWGRAQGMTIMRGPLNFSLNQECGLLVEGFGEPPLVMMTYNPPSYSTLIETNGYTKVMDMYAYVADLETFRHDLPPKVVRAGTKAMQSAGLRVRKVEFKHFAAELQRVKHIYNAAWADNWGFVPMTEREFDQLAADLKHVLDPNLILIAETADGAPIGFSLALPDLHQALRWSGGGHMFPFGLLKFLWYKRQIKQVRLLTMGVVEAYRGRGIDAVFYGQTVRNALARGYERIEGSWVLESNTMMNRIIERLGGIRHKTYRIYEKALV